MHPSDLAARFMASRRVVRWLVPLGLGVFASLGHETWISGIFAVSTSLILAFLIVPTHPREAAWFGWLLGLSYFAVTMRWLVEPFLVDPVRHGWMAPFAIIFMAGAGPVLGVFVLAGPMDRWTRCVGDDVASDYASGDGTCAWPCFKRISLGFAVLYINRWFG